MIKLTDKMPVGEGILFDKIRAESAAYAGFPSALFYKSGDAALSLIDSNLTVAGDMDAEELNEFIRFTGALTLTCPTTLAEKLGVKNEEFLVLKAPAYGKTVRTVCAEAKEVYTLLKNGEDGDIDLPDYESFLLDYSLRVRRGVGFGVVVGGAVCVAAAVSGKSVIISGVANEKGARGKGFALQSVLKMRMHFGDKDCFCFCREPLLPFYAKCGFKVFGKISRSKL